MLYHISMPIPKPASDEVGVPPRLARNTICGYWIACKLFKRILITRGGIESHILHQGNGIFFYHQGLKGLSSRYLERPS